MRDRELLNSFLRSAQAAADPRAALRPHLAQLQTGQPLALLAFGKASLEMADEVLLALAPQIARGAIACVPERLESLAPQERERFASSKIALLPADHPLPTDRNLAAAAHVRDFVASLGPSDHLLVLISGGGSAHLTLPALGLTLGNLRDVTRLLQRAGCDIRELNAVRKHCEQLKGGRLATLCRAGCVSVLVLSDVLGDPLDVVSSGPFSPDPSTYAEALGIVEGSGGHAPAIVAHLERGKQGLIPETPKQGDAAFRSVTTTIIGSNRQLVDALARHASSLSIHVEAKWYDVSGDAIELSQRIGAFLEAHPPSGAKRALIIGGEWTVRAAGSTGKGGPSQELALALAIRLARAGPSRVHARSVLVYSSDGIDGPTDAAGAIVDETTAAPIAGPKSDPHVALQNHDSHGYLTDHPRAIHLKTGPTGTNVNHIAVVLF